MQVVVNIYPTGAHADGDGAKGKCSDNELASQNGVTNKDEWVPLARPSSFKVKNNANQHKVSADYPQSSQVIRGRKIAYDSLSMQHYDGDLSDRAY